MNYEYQDSRIILFPEERIDSGNSADIEKEINDILAEKEITSVIMDLKDLTYISSAGLRILLHVRKAYSDTKLVNVKDRKSVV